MTPYQEALQWIKRNPGTGSASSLAKLVLSFWNSDCSFAFRECVSNLDGNLTSLAVRMAGHFAERGEDQDLIDVGHEINKLYPRLWDLGQAMTGARRAQTEQWRHQDEAESARLYPNG